MKPKIKSDEVLIKVKATAICGTDFIFGIGMLGQAKQLNLQ